MRNGISGTIEPMSRFPRGHVEPSVLRRTQNNDGDAVGAFSETVSAARLSRLLMSSKSAVED
jgi:hypothetical protein